eukprot:750874-Pyramimonas_sp.AAC.1
MEGGLFSKCGSRLRAAQCSRASQIEGGTFSICGSRVSAAHMDFLQQKQEFADGGRLLFKMWISP